MNVPVDEWMEEKRGMEWNGMNELGSHKDVWKRRNSHELQIY